MKKRVSYLLVLIAVAVMVLLGKEQALAADNDNLIVVLDPGHDSTHCGARRDNLREETINLAIAGACARELEKYDGVTVYLTRTTSACASKGSSTALCNKNRAVFAKGKKADVLISLHVDATGTILTKAKGAMVMYTAYSKYKLQMRQLSYSVLSSLGEIGYYSRGAKTNNDDHNFGKYMDGTWMDDIFVMRQSALYDIPSILIEHGFINNPLEAYHFETEEGLREVGVADAEGIAAYYGLEKVSDLTKPDFTSVGSPNSTRVNLEWEEVEGAESYCVFRSQSKNGEYTLLAEGLTETSYQDLSVTGGGLYYYKIQAVAEGDQRENDPVSIRVLKRPDVTLASMTSGNITIKWNSIYGADGYIVRRSTTKTGNYTTIKKITSGTRLYAVDTGAREGVTYYYRVYAYRCSNGRKSHSSYSVPVSGMTVGQVGSIEITEEDGACLVTWAPVDNATGYRIYRQEEDQENDTLIGTVDSSVLQFEDLDRETDIYYEYYIKAFWK